MKKIKTLCQNLVTNRIFEMAIILVILINSVLIGVETYFTTSGIKITQGIILLIFTLEIALRFIARTNTKSFFQSGWNNFDLFLVLINYIPEAVIANTSMLMALRVLRVFRVLRLLRTSREIKLIIAVLSKSFSALFYNGVFFFIFLYLFAIMGVSLFRLPNPDTLTPEKQESYAQFVHQGMPNTPQLNPDPYGTLSEAMFTLFRALTSDDWSELRYSLVKASDYHLIPVPGWVVTTFHVVWFVLAAFLLLNLVVGAIVNNYQIIMEETRRKEEQEKLEAEAGS